MTQTNYSLYDPGTVFMYEHDGWWSPFLIMGMEGPSEYSTYYMNHGRVLKRKFEAYELEDESKIRILGAIDLTEYILDSLNKRTGASYRLLDSIFNYMRGIERGGEDG